MGKLLANVPSAIPVAICSKCIAYDRVATGLKKSNRGKNWLYLWSFDKWYFTNIMCTHRYPVKFLHVTSGFYSCPLKCITVRRLLKCKLKATALIV